jgi:hypothetical protein
MTQQATRLGVEERMMGVSETDDNRRRWKPAANHPWRQYRSVYLQKKRLAFLRQQTALAEAI